MSRFRAGIAIIAIALSACATTPRSAPERSYAGRFVATADSGERRDSVSGRFLIEIRGQQQLIELATPVGTTLARIEIEPGHATVTDGKLQGISGPDADELLQQALGWRLPVTGLSHWLEGQPDPARKASISREGERISEIRQDGWIIRITEVSGPAQRPRRLQFDRAASAAEPGVSVRLIIESPD